MAWQTLCFDVDNYAFYVMDPYRLLSYFWFVHEKMFKWNFVFNSLLNGLATYFLQYHVKDVPVGNKVKVC